MAAQIYGWPIGSWNVSAVTDFGELFDAHPQGGRNARAAEFNEDISSWDMSSATNMFRMFRGATSSNGTLSFWNVSSVENMAQMFLDAVSFNGDVSSWNVSRVLTMRVMFRGASSFRQDLCSTWGPMVSANIVDSMFLNTNCPTHEDPVLSATPFAGPFCFACSMRPFEVSQELRDAVDAYLGDDSPNTEVAQLRGWPIGSWDVSALEDFSRLFDAFGRNTRASEFNEDISTWNVSRAVNM